MDLMKVKGRIVDLPVNLDSDYFLAQCRIIPFPSSDACIFLYVYNYVYDNVTFIKKAQEINCSTASKVRKC